MDIFKNNDELGYKINNLSTIKDYFDMLLFFQERFYGNIRNLLNETAIESSIGIVCFLFVKLFSVMLVFKFNAVIAYFFFLIMILIIIIIVRNLKLAKREKQKYNFSVLNMIERLISDGVTLNRKDLETKISFNDIFKKLKVNVILASVMSVMSVMFTIAFVASVSGALQVIGF